jgi:hypothetical protein
MTYEVDFLSLNTMIYCLSITFALIFFISSSKVLRNSVAFYSLTLSISAFMVAAFLHLFSIAVSSDIGGVLYQISNVFKLASILYLTIFFMKIHYKLRDVSPSV